MNTGMANRNTPPTRPRVKIWSTESFGRNEWACSAWNNRSSVSAPIPKIVPSTR